MIGPRDPRSEDSARVFLWRRSPGVGRSMRRGTINTFEAHERWFDALRDDPDQAFGDLTRRTVTSEVLAYIEVALRAKAAAGYRREGYSRRQVLNDGVERDVVPLGVLASDGRPSVTEPLASRHEPTGAATLT